MVRGPTHSGRSPAHLTVLPGGAQRVVDDDERTTIEPGPPQDGDEASTPIANLASDEHWEDGTTVAESAKKLLEEATIDDQARTLPPLQLVPPVNPRAQARLVVVTGPDQGRHYDLGGGNKPMQVGRAMENDVVLTDLSVSRRHLELVWEPDRWILRDCGSGNGTLINDRLEDGQCQLRHGDRIEIGNTTFRFDHAASADGDGSIDVPLAGWGQGEDDEELATVNGRPGKSGETALPEAAALAARAPYGRVGPTVPPTPRPRSTTSTPSVPPPRPARPTGPPPGPGPQLLTSPRGGLASASGSGALPAGAAAGASPSMPGFRLDTMRPPMGAFPPSAAPVMVPSLRPWPFAALQRFDRRKLFLAIGGGALGLAVIIGAIASGGDGPASAGLARTPSAGGAAKAALDPTAGRTGDLVIAPLVGSGGPPVTAGSGAGSLSVDPAGLPPVAPGSGAAPGAGSMAAPGSGAGSAIEPGAGSAIEPGPGTGSGPGSTMTAGVGAGSTMTAGVGAGSTVTAGVGAGSAVTAGVGAGSAVTAVTPGVASGATPPRPTDPVATTTRVKPVAPRPERPKPDRVERPTRIAVAPSPPPPRAAASSKAIAAAEKKAEDQYRARKFSEAASTLRVFADDAASAEAKRLSGLATNYESLGNNLTSGASGDAVVAYRALTRALATDRKVGGAHQSLIRERLAQVTPSAASTYVARSKYVEAKKAADDAVNFGAGTNPTIALVRSKLEAKAGTLYTEASKLMAKKPDEARAQLKVVMQMVESDSPWYAKASRMLKSAPSRDDDE